jgi:AcrR family transcriptional regulator
MKPTTEKIVTAAAQLFSSAGFRGTSIREIAALSGFTEITVFRHFPQKEELFWTAVESKLIEADLRARLESGSQISESSEAAARRLANTTLSALLGNAELNRLLFVSALELDPAPPRVQRYLRPILLLIADRLRPDHNNGHSEPRAPHSEQAAMALAAIALSHGFLGGLFGSEKTQDLPPGEAIKGYCDIWLHGVSVSSH